MGVGVPLGDGGGIQTLQVKNRKVSPSASFCGWNDSHASFWCAENEAPYDGLSSPLVREMMFSGPLCAFKA